MADYRSLELSEKDWQAQVVGVLQDVGFITYHTYNSRRSTAGFPDLVAVKPPRVLFIELKKQNVPRHKPTRTEIAQIIWRVALLQCPGVETYLWRPEDWDAIVEILR